MARLTVAACFGVLVGLVAGAALGIRASTEEDLGAVVDLTGVDGSSQADSAADAEPDLTVEDRRAQLPPEPAVNPRVECVIWHESRGIPTAVNPRSGAAGLGQFMPSTWRTTPQGKAGYSVFNAEANRAAVAWMLAVGRGREFQVITRGLC